jgi:protein gp37
VSSSSRTEWTQVTWKPVTGCDRISAGDLDLKEIAG